MHLLKGFVLGLGLALSLGPAWVYAGLYEDEVKRGEATPALNNSAITTETPPVERSPNARNFNLAQNKQVPARIDREIDKTTIEKAIDKAIEDYNKHPRKKFIGARAEEGRFAQYVENWRKRIEEIGTINYPDAARGKISGSLLLSVSIRPDGTVERAEILRSSGHPVLDEAALRIVHLASPFAPFPEEIRRDTNLIEITRTWYFKKSDKLGTD